MLVGKELFSRHATRGKRNVTKSVLMKMGSHWWSGQNCSMSHQFCKVTVGVGQIIQRTILPIFHFFFGWIFFLQPNEMKIFIDLGVMIHFRWQIFFAINHLLPVSMKKLKLWIMIVYVTTFTHEQNTTERMQCIQSFCKYFRVVRRIAS